jgi:nucleotide-binding universal stress UspA family protein
MKILLAIDGSKHTKRMLAYLAAHREDWLHARHAYSALHVVPQVPPRAAAVVDKATLKAYYAEQAEDVFGPVRKFLAQRGVTAKEMSVQGHAAQVIAKTADEGKFDLLVMGSHGHGALGNLVMGSVATRVLAECGTPVLLVR